MNRIPDWSVAREEATHYHPENDMFYVAQGGNNFHIAGREACGRVSVSAAWLAGLVQRPATAAWDGDGMPPVGTVCEALIEKWFRVEVFAHKQNEDGGTDVLFTYTTPEGHQDWYWLRDPNKFRLLRTPEQIAAEEREKAITEMWKSVETVRGEDVAIQRKTCADLYDAGFRKVEGGAE